MAVSVCEPGRWDRHGLVAPEQVPPLQPVRWKLPLVGVAVIVTVSRIDRAAGAPAVHSPGVVLRPRRRFRCPTPTPRS